MCHFQRLVTSSELPKDESSTTILRTPDDENDSRRTVEIKTRYVAMPILPEHLRARRNLVWGIIFVVASVVIFWLGTYITGAAAPRSFLTAVGTFFLLWLLYSLRLLRQRHGVFIAFSLVALLGAVVPFVELGYIKLDSLARNRFAANPEKAAPAVVVPAQPAAPVVVSNAPAPVGEKSDGVIRIEKDTNITVEGAQWQLKEGETYPLVSFEDGRVSFKKDGKTGTIDAASVTFTTAKVPDEKVSTAAITKQAKAEAARRYPELSKFGSEANDVYISTYRELQAAAPDYFKDPEWPIKLAELIAEREGWRRADMPEVPDASTEKSAPAETTVETAPAPENNPPVSDMPDVPTENVPPVPQANP